MITLVQKFGGTSVETPEHLLDVAKRILEEKRRGRRLLVVVSAMGQSTDKLVELAEKISPNPPRREMDMLLTAGERISMALLAIALDAHDVPAVSFTGSQSGIITDNRHSDARITEIRPIRIEEELKRDRVVIVAGFQGVSPQKDVTTLGRGGSDTTAVVLAIHFKCPRCEIFTDVHGVMTADPRVVPSARTLPRISYDTAILLSHLGAQVIYRRSVLLARKFRMPLRVRCSLSDGCETWIGQPPEEFVMQADHTVPMESDRILSVALEPRCVAVEIKGRSSPAELLKLLESDDPGCPWTWIKTHRQDGETLIHAVRPETEAEQKKSGSQANSAGAQVEVVRNLAIVSLVGEALLTRPEIHGESLEILDKAGIAVSATHSTGLSLSLLVSSSAAVQAVKLLHSRFVEESG
jgi:aspartate kinase